MNISIRDLIDLEPAVVRGVLVALVGVLATGGLVIVDAEVYISLVVALLPILQAFSTRKVVSPTKGLPPVDDHLAHEGESDEEVIVDEEVEPVA